MAHVDTVRALRRGRVLPETGTGWFVRLLLAYLGLGDSKHVEVLAANRLGQLDCMPQGGRLRSGELVTVLDVPDNSKARWTG